MAGIVRSLAATRCWDLQSRSFKIFLILMFVWTCGILFGFYTRPGAILTYKLQQWLPLSKQSALTQAQQRYDILWNTDVDLIKKDTEQVNSNDSTLRHGEISTRLMEGSTEVAFTASTERYRSTTPDLNVRNTTEDQNVTMCTFPTIDPFDPKTMYLIKKYDTIDCSNGVPSYVFQDGNTLRVNNSKVISQLGKNDSQFFSCRYRTQAMKRGDDFSVIVSKDWSKPFNQSIRLLDRDEHLIIECYKRSSVVSRSYISLIREKKELERNLAVSLKKHLQKHSPKETLSVFVIGLDGMSKHNLLRAMPLTRNVLVNNMKAIELHKYNKIGLNTFPNVVPLMSGIMAEELLDKYNWTWRQHLDRIDHIFLWNEYARAGYRTAMVLDHDYITAFHCQKKGWSSPPVHYYNRPTVLASLEDKLVNKQKFCLGDTPDFVHYNNYLLQLARTFNNSKDQPYFSYSFYARLTHDHFNFASSGDAHHARFLQSLYEENLLNNTVLVYFSDHGLRFGSYRSTYNGMIEAKTPYLFLVFPEWFHRKYPELISTLKVNQERLATHGDVYETLRDILYFKAESGIGDAKNRGISLFKTIPENRTCQDMGVAIKYCVCNHFSQSNVDPNFANYLSLTLIEQVNKNTKDLRRKCVILSLNETKSVLKIDKNLNENKKENGTQFYQITIETMPGGALYEATLAYTRANAVVSGDISRLNLYRGQAECIEDPKLRPFCFCKKKEEK